MTSINEYNNFCHTGIKNLNESALYFCDTASPEEKSNMKHSAPSLTSNPSNSTADENNDNNVPQLEEYIQLDWEGSASKVSMQVEHSQGSQESLLIQESVQAKDERTAAQTNHFLSVTESTDSPAQTVEQTPVMNDFEGSDLNENDTGIQVEEDELQQIKADQSESKTKHKQSKQSKYKNKPKELFQKAVQIYHYLKNLNEDEYMRIMIEDEKTPEQWARESELLEMFWELKAKQYCCFAGLCELMPEILQQAGDVVLNFKKYKDKISHKYFKAIKSEDLFSWMLLTQIAMVLLPEDPEYVELLPFKKSTVSLATWLIESRMTEENKDLYRDSTVRSHLREVMTEIYNNLMNQALTKMDEYRLTLLQRTSKALGTTFAPMQETPRRIVRTARHRVNPQYNIGDGVAGKRSFSRGPVLSGDLTTKKVNKQRK